MHTKNSQSITDRARELASFGLNQQMIAAALGISRSTFYRRLAEFPELEQAIEQGRALAIAEVAQKMMARAKSGDDFQSMAFILRSRGGFDDRPLKQEQLDGLSEKTPPMQSLNVCFIDTPDEWDK